MPTATSSCSFDVTQSIDCRGTLSRQRAATVAVQVLFDVADACDCRLGGMDRGGEERKERSVRVDESDVVIMALSNLW